MAPLAAFTMAGLLFVYTRTSIRAAKLNAQKSREADGGQISWHNESLRRHGQMQKVDSDKNNFKEALMSDVKVKKQPKDEDAEGKPERSAEEANLRKIMGKDK